MGMEMSRGKNRVTGEKALDWEREAGKRAVNV